LPFEEKKYTTKLSIVFVTKLTRNIKINFTN
jgi:hypothetical protein